MKVFALGGYGKVGLPANKLLAQSDLVTEIAIAGRSLGRAEKAAKEIGKKAKAVQADGVDEKQIASLAAGYEIIVNMASNEAVLPALKAAIRIGAHYSDVAWGPIIEPALELTAQARDAGITAIICTGVSPCISNLMGVYAAGKLEEVEQLQLGRAVIVNFQSGRELTPRLWLKDPNESLAALDEFKPFIAWALQRLQDNGIRTMRVYQKGEWVEMDAIRSGVEVPLTQGGTVIAYPYVSGDPLFGSLPSNLSRVPPVEMWFTPFPPQLHDLLREQALGVLEGDFDSDTAVSSFYDTIERDPRRWLTLPDDFAVTAKMWVTSVGRKKGRAARHCCWFIPAMWNVGGYYLSSVAQVVAVNKILRGEIRERGVMTAETALEPLPFFDETASLLPEPPPDGKLIGESFEWLE
jgi:saccharopine dehydrogenase-like NADP-dependent oxidoreductase